MSIDWTDDPTFIVDTFMNGGTVPNNVWDRYLQARATAVEQLRRGGRSYADIVQLLNFRDVQHCEFVHKGIQPYIREKGQ